MGDSGYLILRKRAGETKLLYESVDMLHGFNFPYQVGTAGDNPYDASILSHKVELGDIIVLATDGLWDNLNKTQIIDIVQNSMEDGNGIKNLNKLAKELAQTAQKVALREDVETPFSQKAKKVGEIWPGGKLDDITIIVAQIVKEKVMTPSRAGDLQQSSPINTWLLMKCVNKAYSCLLFLLQYLYPKYPVAIVAAPNSMPNPTAGHTLTLSFKYAIILEKPIEDMHSASITNFP
eukprot:TRINITY_DN71794_c0_g1_i1.p2 TRINITY_DN71794_c0_g1~~TRINITY_DN71794_c0_g1_i1.p2  ORF type:complete len:235 (+),score=14.55 TRINITY_DN71794_c0_g1_i1:620-1324(+)